MWSVFAGVERRIIEKYQRCSHIWFLHHTQLLKCQHVVDDVIGQRDRVIPFMIAASISHILRETRNTD